MLKCAAIWWCVRPFVILLSSRPQSYGSRGLTGSAADNMDQEPSAVALNDLNSDYSELSHRYFTLRNGTSHRYGAVHQLLQRLVSSLEQSA